MLLVGCSLAGLAPFLWSWSGQTGGRQAANPACFESSADHSVVRRNDANHAREELIRYQKNANNTRENGEK